MVWGWNYGGGLGSYAHAWLQRTENAPTFAAWHAREAARRAHLGRRLELERNGYPVDLSLQKEAEEFGGLSREASLDDRIAWHLTQNLYPAAPLSMVSACAQAIRFMAPDIDPENVWYNLSSPSTFTPRDERLAASPTLGEVIRQHSLSRFIIDAGRPRYGLDRRWDLSDALEAWEQANQGKWEIPSPIPDWPEFVTVLLVGRNFHERGEEDEPSERDLIRSWWGSDGWRRGYNAGWWDAQTVRLMSLPEPVPGVHKPASPTARPGSSGDPHVAPAPKGPQSTSSMPVEWASRYARIGPWLDQVACGALLDPEAFLPLGWKGLIDQIWRDDDLSWTEELIRNSKNRELYPGMHPTGMANLDALHARVLLAQGRYEDVLRALEPLAPVWGSASEGLPYWWFQVRDLAAGRLAVQAHDPAPAVSHFLNVIAAPYPARFVDPDYLLAGLHELSILDYSKVEGAPQRQEWVRLALGVEDGLRMWSTARGWNPPTGYNDEQREQFRAVLAGRRVQWAPRDAELSPLRSRFDWSGELDALEEILDELVTLYEFNRFVHSRPYIEEIGHLWDPLQPGQSRLLTAELLADAYYERGRTTVEATTVRDAAWHRDPLAIVQLEAMHARALASQGDIEDARSACKRGFATTGTPIGWILQLEAITNGRIEKASGSREGAFDFFWLAVRNWLKADTDEDLLLETLCELATLGPVSPLHPDPGEWTSLIEAMTGDRPDDEWKPGSWYDREFRSHFEQVQGRLPRPS